MRGFRLIGVEEGEFAGNIVPIIAVIPAPTEWGKPRRHAIAAGETKKLCERDLSRVQIKVRNLDSATYLYVSGVNQDVATGDPIDPLDGLIIAQAGELWGYAAAEIQVSVWESFLEAR